MRFIKTSAVHAKESGSTGRVLVIEAANVATPERTQSDCCEAICKQVENEA